MSPGNLNCGRDLEQMAGDEDNKPRILVDADGCPVVDAAISLAARHQLSCVLFCDTSHELEKIGAKTIVVDQGADSADFALANHIRHGDIVVTQDYGLAAMALAKKACVFNQDGRQYTADNIDMLLNVRYERSKQRRKTGRGSRIPKRTQEQNKSFYQSLHGHICQRDI